jgi:DNA-directed RNA polymerase
VEVARERDQEAQPKLHVSDRVLLEEDMITAERMAANERFFTPMNCDWRGRVYGLCHFNFQREDRVRALFEFADGEAIGEEGLWWLKVHVANCGDFDKISKRPLKERVEWVDDNERWYRDLVRERALARPRVDEGRSAVPVPRSLYGVGRGEQHRTGLCLVLARQLRRVVQRPATPVCDDASRRGLPGQPDAQELPQDVYQKVADIVRQRVAEDTESPLAQAWLTYGIDRKVVKRNVMTYSYSSKKFGMAAQQEEDLITPLGFKVLSGEVDEHPFSYWAEKKHRDSPSPAATYIAKHTYAGIETIVEKPAEAMGFLQKLARTLAHEGKPVRWTTPTGIPWINRYHQPVANQVKLWMHDKGVRAQVKIKLATEFKKEIDKDRAANGVAPNFVHALDAAHLMLTVNAAAAEGITALATVHDSFGCLASSSRALQPNHPRRVRADVRDA